LAADHPLAFQGISGSKLRRSGIVALPLVSLTGMAEGDVRNFDYQLFDFMVTFSFESKEQSSDGDRRRAGAAPESAVDDRFTVVFARRFNRMGISRMNALLVTL
jgi:hypothetical protein